MGEQALARAFWSRRPWSYGGWVKLMTRNRAPPSWLSRPVKSAALPTPPLVLTRAVYTHAVMAPSRAIKPQRRRPEEALS
jgi:hypothetical protein